MSQRFNSELRRKVYLVTGISFLLCVDTASAQLRDIRPHHIYTEAQYAEKEINERYRFFVSDFVNLVEAVSQNPMIPLLMMSTSDDTKRAFLEEYSEISQDLVVCANNLLPTIAEQAQSGRVPETFSAFDTAMRSSGSQQYLDTFLSFMSETCNIEGLPTLWEGTTVFHTPSTIDYYGLENDSCTERFVIDDWYFSRSVTGHDGEQVEFEDTIGTTAENFRLHFNLNGHGGGYIGGSARVWVLGYQGQADAATAALQIAGRSISPLPFEAFNPFGGSLYFDRGLAVPDIFNVLNGFRSGGKELSISYQSYLEGNRINSASASEVIVLPNAGNLMGEFSAMGERPAANVRDGSCDPLRLQRSLLTGEVVKE